MEYLGADFAEQYHQLMSTYVSNRFEDQHEMDYHDLDTFLEAKHRSDNTEMSHSGTRVLTALQQKLQPLNLETCSAEIKRALFLVLIGTILAAGRARCEACGAFQVSQCLVNCVQGVRRSDLSFRPRSER